MDIPAKSLFNDGTGRIMRWNNAALQIFAQCKLEDEQTEEERRLFRETERLRGMQIRASSGLLRKFLKLSMQLLVGQGVE